MSYTDTRFAVKDIGGLFIYLVLVMAALVVLVFAAVLFALAFIVAFAVEWFNHEETADDPD